MSTKTRAGRDWSKVGDDAAFFTQVFKLMAFMIGRLPEDDQPDMIELLQATSQARTAEEMVAAEETIREILSPKTGAVLPLPDSSTRQVATKRWAEYSGNLLRQYRKAAGMSQVDLAAKAGLPQSHISRIESNEISPTRSTIEKIAVALNRPLRDFDPSA